MVYSFYFNFSKSYMTIYDNSTVKIIKSIHVIAGQHRHELKLHCQFLHSKHQAVNQVTRVNTTKLQPYLSE